MCGIVGFTGPPRPDTLRAMCDALAHRGPDDAGYAQFPEVSLGMRRLAIVDLEGGRQPMANEDGTVVTVFNGEIYNHLAMRSELARQGHRFATGHSDTECVVHAFEEHGDDWPERCAANGMFGLAIWDARTRRLVLYRDRVGKKPLYYAAIPGGVAFASEIKALLVHPEVSRELDFPALYGYFGHKCIAAPHTAYQAIRQLPPGHLLAFGPETGLGTPRPYWRADFSPPPAPVHEDQAAARVLELLADAVRLRMDCDVSYGAYLSGGMDSSAVATLMSRFSSRPVMTFCLGYEDLTGGQAAGKDADLRFARMVAKRLCTDHHEHIVSAAGFAKDLPDALAAMDEPFSGAISTYFLSSFMRRHITVAVSGDGSDELFASYLPQRLAFPLAARRAAQAAGKPPPAIEGDVAADLLARLADCPGHAHTGWRDALSVFSHTQRRELLSPDFLAAAGEAVGRNPFDALDRDLTAADALNAQLEIDQRGLLPDQVLPFVDRLSMAHSIEVRCPFLDHRLVEYVNGLPGDQKIRGGVTKYILRRALEGVLPAEVIDRPKEGFVQPVYTWMHGPLQKLVASSMDGLPDALFRRRTVARLRDGFLSGERGLEARIWNLVCFSLWFSRHAGNI
ncbi:asparagine synthase (glutamine-hydrolyzing) [Desulfolutivibrio sulfoxidireducens]|uniref:asparagine synthase (glutamine-hydrolyzing) n=1 Tax=Desulfolutivibrio sulfoxidireducens TaxID=2773299 RepID=UPI00159D4495|nr:asparagine synthase (glutamine-hydrolyzing) [Desulfolutivibrio sulfoxidireducens]QLA15813.1 asparagine synthase (glutamine-hydrolyzing) [Desulfolutivibrio sulfoxidireducens]